jgi:peroxiredoxin
MRSPTLLALAVLVLAAPLRAEEPAKAAPKVVLQSPDGSKSYDLAQLVAEGPVLVRLTCACTGCDLELPFFQKLQDAYNARGLKTVAIFREKPEAAESYAVKKGVNFIWLSDPKGDLWKTFESNAMPTNILIDKGGRIVKVLGGCTKDGRNAQALSAEVARLLGTDVVPVAEPRK